MDPITTLVQRPDMKNVLAMCKSRVGPTLDLAIAVQQIPSPTFAEGERANFVERKFRELGLANVSQDAMHNVFAAIPGKESQWPVILSAHTDTVFDFDVDLSVRYANGDSRSSSLISGPGLADNALGVAGLIEVASLLTDAKLRPTRPIWFAANVCEEGLGDLRGMRSVLEKFGQQATYIVIEGGSFGHVFHQAIGVSRFRITVKTPGGHSWGDYGSPNAIHLLSQIISRIDSLKLPDDPKTTVNVGAIEGGTTINTIAAQSSCLVDMRSVEPATLQRLVESVEQIAKDCTKLADVSMTMTQIGNRPAGVLPRNTPVVTWAVDALRYVDCQDISLMAGSTDANIPISMGVPSVCIGLAKSGNAHRLDEFLDPTNLPKGLAQLLLLTLAASGLESELDNEKE